MTTKKPRWLIVVALLLAGLVAATACEPDDPNASTPTTLPPGTTTPPLALTTPSALTWKSCSNTDEFACAGGITECYSDGEGTLVVRAKSWMMETSDTIDQMKVKFRLFELQLGGNWLEVRSKTEKTAKFSTIGNDVQWAHKKNPPPIYSPTWEVSAEHPEYKIIMNFEFIRRGLNGRREIDAGHCYPGGAPRTIDTLPEIGPDSGVAALEGTPQGAVVVASLDRVAVEGDAIRVTGWAYDPDDPEESVDVSVTLDGEPIWGEIAEVPRPDLNTAFAIPGDHGFDFTIPHRPGNLCVSVSDANGGESPAPGWPGCRQIGPLAAPRGAMEIVARNGVNVRMYGWMFDPDNPLVSGRIDMTYDGVPTRSIATDLVRSDINNANAGVSGAHGFDISVASPAGGRACFTAIDTNGSNHTALGCFDVPAYQSAPRGAMEIVARNGMNVRMYGWMFDPDNPLVSGRIDMTYNGVPTRSIATDLVRSDINNGNGISGAHGFDVSVESLAGGQACFTAIDTNGSSHTSLGCFTVPAFQSVAPRGSMEIVARNGVNVRMYGWMFDPDNPSVSGRIDMTYDGVPTRSIATDLVRGDINNGNGISGAHGFDISVVSPAGGQACFTAIDTNGSNHVSLGCFYVPPA